MALLKPQHRDGTSRSHKGKGTCSSNQGERKDILRDPRHARPVPLRNILSSRSVTSVPRDNAQSCVTGRSGKGALLDDVGIEAKRAASGLLRCQTAGRVEIDPSGLLKARGAYSKRSWRQRPQLLKEIDQGEAVPHRRGQHAPRPRARQQFDRTLGEIVARAGICRPSCRTLRPYGP